MGERSETLEGPGVHHDGADPCDDVRPERLLTVEHRVDGDRRPGRQVEQRAHAGGRAEVEGHAEHPVGSVAGLDVNEDVVGHYGRHFEVALAEDPAERPQSVQVDPKLKVVHRVKETLRVAELI